LAFRTWPYQLNLGWIPFEFFIEDFPGFAISFQRGPTPG